MSRDRRRDPRTNHLYSLRNLLRVSAQKFQLPLLVLGTDHDVLIAGSEESFEAQEVLLRASRSREAAPDHSQLRFTVQGQTLVLVARGAPSGVKGLFPGFLESVLLRAIAQRVEVILNEPVTRELPVCASEPAGALPGRLGQGSQTRRAGFLPAGSVPPDLAAASA